MNRIGIFILLTMMVVLSNVQGQSTKENFITTDDGTRLFVKSAGNGPMAIFIHGGPGAWSKSFEALKGNNLEKQLRMVYYDQRGCGRSEKSKTGDYSMDRMIHDIDQIRKHYGKSKVYLIAHSFGGILAANYAKRFPQHVKGLILLNCTLDLRYSLNNQIQYINQILNTQFATPDTSHTSLMATFLKAKKAISAKGLNYQLLSDSKSNVAAVDRIDRTNPSDYDFAKHVFQIEDYWKDYTKMTARIDLPVLVITGAKDHSIGENHYKLFKFKNAKIDKIDGGHILYYENNNEFTKRVFDFTMSKQNLE